MTNKSKELRYMLATAGIILDDPPVERDPTPVTAIPRSERMEFAIRDRIREILIAAGAPAHDVGWLTDSCPSVEVALGYTPPPERAI